MGRVKCFLMDCAEIMTQKVVTHITNGEYKWEIYQLANTIVFSGCCNELLTWKRTNRIGAYLEYASLAIIEYTKDLTRIGGPESRYELEDVSKAAAFAIREACCGYIYGRLRYKSRHDRRIIQANLDNIKMFISCGAVVPALDMIQKYFPYIPTSDKALMELAGRN
jgi:hypothetical protein